MSSKETILKSIRRNRPESSDLPELAHEWTTFDDRRAKFIEVLEAVGGAAIIARDKNELNEQLKRLPQAATAQRVASLVSGVGTPNVELDAAKQPHDLATVDIAIMAGDFAVAENAAVWVTDRNLTHRVLYFLCQHLVLVVPNAAIVDHMHAAYEQIAAGHRDKQAGFAEPAFGVFISGPSKTADIEQQLVIGAHGPRSLTVCFLET
jgi:L-lactate dehydrogenase complex protein LldG